MFMMLVLLLSSFQSCLTLCESTKTVARQAPLSMGFSRQEYWSGLLFPSPGDLRDSGIEPRLSYLLHWHVGSLPLVPQNVLFQKSCTNPDVAYGDGAEIRDKRLIIEAFFEFKKF